MYVQRLLAINMASFAALGTVLLGLGEGNPTLSLVAVLAAMAAVWITDILGVFRLNRRVTNVAVLLAVLRSLWELFQIQTSVQVVAIANLLAYVMIILLFQEKDVRTWWHIALLSILQVAASATFFQGVWFAPLLLLYFFLGISATALLFLHYERNYYHQMRHRPIVPRDTRTVSDRLGVNWRRLGKIVLATFVVGPVSLFLDYGETDAQRRVRKRPVPKDPGTGRWPLIHDEAEFTGSADSLGGRAGVGIEFYRHLAGLIPGTLVVAIVLFMFIPRLGRFNISLTPFGRMTFGDRPTAPLTAVGFSDEVELSDSNNLIEDPEEVMRIQFLQPDAEEAYPVRGQVYLRGALLTQYRDGKWSFDGSGFASASMGPPLLRVNPYESDLGPGLVRQRLTIQPLDRQELFCVWPFVPVEQDGRVLLDMLTERLTRSDSGRRRQVPYLLGTYALVDGSQLPLTPCSPRIRPQHLLRIPADDLPALIKTASEWIEESGLDETQVVERAQYLESKFLTSEGFAYSLQQSRLDRGLDPVEDFIQNARIGHCEYFATALTLMLRSQGIPARMVIGFVTNEYDSLGEYYRVRQRDAHTWVEAYIAPANLPDVRPFGRADADWSGGGWLRLDSTPSRMADATAFGALVGNVENWFEWMKSAWVSYVVEMDSTRQQAAVYTPLKSLLVTLKQELIDANGWQGLWRTLVALPARLRSLLADAGWFSWIGVALLLGTLGFGYVAYRLVRLTVRFVAWLLPRGRSRAGRLARVAFYRRLEALFARRGLRRRPGQTQREFAAAATRELVNGQDENSFAAALLVTDAFYHVRFGSGDLDSKHAQRVEQALHQLEQAAAGRCGTQESSKR